MSKKKEIKWEDLLGESALPADEFTWTDGSNFGLDGYHHDQTMGEGVATRPVQPGATPGGIRPSLYNASTQSVGELPEDMFTGGGPDVSFVDSDPLHIVADGVNLTDMLNESEHHVTDDQRKEAAGVTDLSWLDPTQEQDPDRLPVEVEADEDYGIPELVEAWGVNRQTDGLRLTPKNKDREAEKYYESIKSPVPSLPGARAANEVFVPAIQRAIRRSHYGHPLKVIAQELVDVLGDSDPRLATVMERIAADHGLAGTVFINANAFPGLKNGKWVKELKKIARSAAYVVTDDDTVAVKLGKQKVKAVNWNAALAHYKSVLAPAGYKFGSGEAKEIIRQAFLAGPEKEKVATGHKPVELRPSDSITAADAFSRLSAAGRSEIQVIESLEKRAVARKRAALRAELQKWADAGKITSEDAMRMASSQAHPTDVRRCLAAMVQAMGNHTYAGVGTRIPKDVHVLRAAAVKSLEEREAALSESEKNKFALELAKQVKAGLLTKDEAKNILSLDMPLNELRRIASMAVQTADQHRRVKLSSADQDRVYGGAIYTAAQNHADKTGVPVNDYIALLKFAAKEMNEGLMGDTLTEMLNVRFTPQLLKAAEPLLNELRSKHEGLAGTIYVDASLYATPTGVTGCEKGALKHRANQVKTVLAMPRCGGCVHAREGRCSVYNKPLIASPDEVLTDVTATQKQMLHMANASDAEVTGSLFNPSEFNLGTQMDELELSVQTSTEKLGEVLFGGLLMGEDE